MQYSKGVYAGIMRINGVTASKQIHIFLSGIDAVISDTPDGEYPKKEIFLYPFSPEMFSRLSNSEDMMRGVEYTISGNHIGSYVFSSIGPPEAVRDWWQVKEFSVKAKYTRSQLTMKISGMTGTGKKNAYYRDNSVFPPVEFDVEFHVPRENMVEFLQIAEGPNKYFEELVDGCKKWKHLTSLLNQDKQ